MSMIPEMKKRMFIKFYTRGFDANHYHDIIIKGKNRYSLAQEGAKEEVASINEQVFKNIDKPMKILIIGSPMCTDTAVAVPSFLEIFKKMSNWEYKIADKRELEDDFLSCLKVGSRATVPQIIFANMNGEIINKWIEKSIGAKIILKEIKEMGLSPEAKKEKILSIPELNSRVESKAVVRELIEVAKKAIYYI